MVERFSPEQIEEFKECFSLYDRDGDGLISSEQMKLVMRSLGQCPTQTELNKMVQNAGKGKISFPQFLDLMWDHMQKSRREFQTEIFEAFKAYDVNNRGSITMKDLRHIMLRTGEKLTPQEFEYMLYQAGISKNAVQVNYNDAEDVDAACPDHLLISNDDDHDGEEIEID